MKILLAGSTGYLGQFILRGLVAHGHEVVALCRRTLPPDAESQAVQFVPGDVTLPHSIAGCCAGIDVVVSTVGITRQRDGLTYRDVDYQANLNLLREAQRSGVGKFVYVSVFGGEAMRETKICAAKERFVAALKSASMSYCVVRPTGFFRDMEEFVQMAKRGKIFLFGPGDHRMNPIHGADLADEIVRSIPFEQAELALGGPEVFTYRQIAGLAAAVANDKARIIRLPDIIRKAMLSTSRAITPQTFHGPLEFFLTVLGTDMVAPLRGQIRLREHFEEVAGKR